MVEQKRFVDDCEGVAAEHFLLDFAEKHHLRDRFPEVEIRYRGVGIDTVHEHITDDKIIQLVVDNRLVAMVFIRRDDWNHSEVTYITIEEALEKCEEMRKRIDSSVEQHMK